MSDDAELKRVWRSISETEESFVPNDLNPCAEANAERAAEWELEIRMYCRILISLPKNELDHQEEEREWAAHWIGVLIAKQLVAQNYAAPRIVSEGLLNLKSNKPFILHSGKEPSRLRLLVLWAFNILQFNRRIKRPSQRDVHDFLLEHGLDLSADRLSKLFDALGLKSLSSDARGTRSGKRKNKET